MLKVMLVVPVFFAPKIETKLNTLFLKCGGPAPRQHKSGWGRVAFVQRKVGCFGFGLLGLLGKVLVLLLMVDKTMTMMICCWGLRPHC